MKINNDANVSALAAALTAERKPAPKHTRQVRNIGPTRLDEPGRLALNPAPFALGVAARYLQN
jgi:hypothetical protein